MKYFVKVENGPDAGLRREIPEEGLSVGRSSQNDLVLRDELLSRRHCRFTLQDGGPVVSDLATVNGTFVNGSQISADAVLKAGDRVAVGDTTLVVEAPEEPALGLQHSQEAAAGSQAEKKCEPLFPVSEPKKKTSLVLPVVVMSILAIVIAAAAKFFLAGADRSPDIAVREEQKDWPLEFSFVKVEGSGDNVFRYEMSMAADGTVSVSVDDLAQNRHLSKTSAAPVSDDARSELRRAFETSGFLSLQPLYEGTPRRNDWREVRISALFGASAATVAVRNRTEPDAIKVLRERLEAFGRNELGLWAFAFGRDKLLEMAEEEFARGERLWAERDVRRDNVHSALRAYRSCIEYLDSLEPKPPLFDQAVLKSETVENELEAIVSDLNWKADHGASVKDWTAAQQALRELLDVLPDRTDPRNKAALARLRDVESRLTK
jgi:hypothetical protein